MKKLRGLMCVALFLPLFFMYPLETELKTHKRNYEEVFPSTPADGYVICNFPENIGCRDPKLIGKSKLYTWKGWVIHVLKKKKLLKNNQDVKVTRIVYDECYDNVIIYFNFVPKK